MTDKAYPPLPEKSYLGDDASYGYDEHDMRDSADETAELRASRNAAGSGISDAQMAEGLKLHRLKHDTPSQLSDAFRAGARWAIEMAPATTQAQEAAAGFVLMPKRMTQAMRDVTDTEGWTWEDLLAAAEVITQEEHAAMASGDDYEAHVTRAQALGAKVTQHEIGFTHDEFARFLAAPTQADGAQGDEAQLLADAERWRTLLTMRKDLVAGIVQRHELADRYKPGPWTLQEEVDAVRAGRAAMGGEA